MDGLDGRAAIVHQAIYRPANGSIEPPSGVNIKHLGGQAEFFFLVSGGMM
jgi:hypothetical protein